MFELTRALNKTRGFEQNKGFEEDNGGAFPGAYESVTTCPELE
jgi:hypothetical protein